VATVAFRDEATTDRGFHSFGIQGVPDLITVRDLVLLRVCEEVARYDATPTRRFQGAGPQVPLRGVSARTVVRLRPQVTRTALLRNPDHGPPIPRR
jgi:hypothetical protein